MDDIVRLIAIEDHLWHGPGAPCALMHGRGPLRETGEKCGDQRLTIGLRLTKLRHELS